MTDRQEEDALWRALKDGDDTAKLALADWYLERKNLTMAHALKWCVKRKIWPRVTPERGYAVWGRLAKRPVTTGADLLPYQIYDAYQRHLEGRHQSVRFALIRLAFALDDLAALCRVPGEGGAA